MTRPENIQENVSLADYSTMRLGGPARYLIEVAHKEQLPDIVDWAESEELPVMMLGGGSNTIFGDAGFDGLIIINKITGFAWGPKEDGWQSVTIGAGVNWDDAVAETVRRGLTGLETLSLVPGTVGAAPVQNIGAYGMELASVFDALEAYDRQARQFVMLSKEDCGFGYRTSKLKTVDLGQYLIASVTLRLQVYKYFLEAGRQDELIIRPPYYADVVQALNQNQITDPTPADVRDMVIQVRQAKLPDPAAVANTGSFFANPVVSRAEFDNLLKTHPELDRAPAGWSQAPRWELPDGRVKLAAGALIEGAGFKAAHDEETGMATWPTQALVLVNERAESTADLLAFVDRVTKKVHETYGVQLEPEVLLINTSN